MLLLTKAKIRILFQKSAYGLKTKADCSYLSCSETGLLGVLQIILLYPTLVHFDGSVSAFYKVVECHGIEGIRRAVGTVNAHPGMHSSPVLVRKVLQEECQGKSKQV